MLEAHCERSVELPGYAECGVGILYVVVGEFLSVELLSRGEGEWNLFFTAVERCALMRVLTVAEALLEVIFKEKLLIQTGLRTHVCSDAHIIFCRMCICLCGKLEAGLPACVAVAADLSQYPAVV